MQLLRTFFRSVTPAKWRRAWRRRFGWRWFRGEYSSWEEARAASKGYDQQVILERVLAATLAVRDGRAAFERDGVTFAQAEPETELVAVLRAIAAERQGRLLVLDFGGALGTTYWRHRDAWRDLAELRWDIVEQPAFVTAGRQHLAQSPLRFFADVAEARAAGGHDVLLASGVLQYLPDPIHHLRAWGSAGFPHIVLNNLPLHAADQDQVRVQHVPPAIYPATYPVWFLSRERFLAHCSSGYEVARSFASEAVWMVDGQDFASTGLWLRRKEPS